jgi:hypothetical protein
VNDFSVHQDDVVGRRLAREMDAPGHLCATRRPARGEGRVDPIRIDPGPRRPGNTKIPELGPVKLDPALHDSYLVHPEALLLPRAVPVIGWGRQTDLLEGIVTAGNGDDVSSAAPGEGRLLGAVHQDRSLSSE